MWIGILGPLHVSHAAAGTPLRLPAARLRTLLAVLAVRPGQAVSFDELADLVWDGEPPAGARPTVRGYVKRLRQALGPELAPRLVTRDPGYLLDVAGDEVDLRVFETLLAEGAGAVRAGAWQQAAHGLSQALALWRGEPLADISSESLRAELLPQLTVQRLQAVEWAAEAGLATGRHQELVAELTGLTAAHPLREHFWAQLMLALYRCGRPGEALAAFQQARQTIVGELGVEPGRVLQDLQQRILAGDPDLLPGAQPAATAAAAAAAAGEFRAGAAGPAATASDEDAARAGAAAGHRPVPRQLPGSVRGFAGRAGPLAELMKLAHGDGGTAVISAIRGTAGVGKTALALHFAHQVADRFRDGSLYVNLLGYGPAAAPLPPAEALRMFLDGLAVPPDRIPAGLAARSGLFRSLVMGKRLLIILDNARDEQQIRPLLPASPGCLVLVTSRNQLTGLIAAEGAHPVTLDVFGEAEARDMLALRLGEDRLAAEPQAVAELIRLCAGLPLALAIVAARAASSGTDGLAALAAEMRQEEHRLNVLATGDPAVTVRAVFSWSLRRLPPGAARMFRLLGLHPGPDISVAAAASLAAVPAGDARVLLRQLAAAHLAAEALPGRFSCHDLLRAYAAEQVLSGIAEDERRAALHRVLAHYLHTAHKAGITVSPRRTPLALPSLPPGSAAARLSSAGEAFRWFEAEHQVLAAAVVTAAARGFPVHAWQIAAALTDLFDRKGYWRDWIVTHRVALTAAEQLGDQRVQAMFHRGLGRAHVQVREFDFARGHLRAALAMFQGLGNLIDEARTRIDIARNFEQQQRYRPALRQSERALELFSAASHVPGQAVALSAIAWCHTCLGDHAEAIIRCQEALVLHRALADRFHEMLTLDSLGTAYQGLGDHARAIGTFQQALALRDHAGEAAEALALLLDHLGDSYQAAGNRDAAAGAWQQALSILDDLGHPEAGHVRAKALRSGARVPVPR